MEIRQALATTASMVFIAGCAERNEARSPEPPMQPASGYLEPWASMSDPAPSETVDPNQPSPLEPDPARGRAAPTNDPSCPMSIEGVRVSTAVVDGAAAIEFATDDEAEVEHLKELVIRMAQTDSAFAPVGEQLPMRHPGPGERRVDDANGGGGPDVPEHTLTVEGTKSGARLVLTPVEPREVDELQRAVHERARFMEQFRSCGPQPDRPRMAPHTL